VRLHPLILIGLLLPFANGCAPPEARFVLSEDTGALEEDNAAGLVAGTLDANFGTPQALVAWEELPVDFGRIEGRVLRATSQADQLLVSLPENPGLNLVDLSLVFTSGGYQAVQTHVAAFDAASRTLTLADALDSPPASGDTFAIVGHVLRRGRREYMHHCMHCHGVSGDGNGPTARYLNPRPRDYRRGEFKYTSTKDGFRASRQDLKRTIQHGLMGTYMPSFQLLADEQLDAIIEYVRWLAMRGELERVLVSELGANSIEQVEGKTALYVDIIASNWRDAEDAGNMFMPTSPRVADTYDSRKRGFDLFNSDTGKCHTCHGPAGRGNGIETETRQKDEKTKVVNQERGLYDDWGNPLRPRDLQSGIYRGGRRPLDIFRRVSVGIKGARMPGFATLKEKQRWDLVNYVLSIPIDGPTPIPHKKLTADAHGHDHMTGRN